VRQRPKPPLPYQTRRVRRTQERLDRQPRERPGTAGSSRSRPAWQSPFALITVAALAVAFAVILLNQKPAPSPTGQLITPPLVYSADILNGESLGQADAPVVMAVYADFQCPVCGRLVREQFGSLRTEFIDTGILRIESRDIAILGSGARDESLELATGASCANEQGRYWAYHDYVYWNQQGENRGDYTEAFLRSIATASGVEIAAWDSCMAGDEARNAVIEVSLAALRAGINSTPSISLNGEDPIPGLPDATALAAAIRSLAAAASATPVP